MTRFGGATSHQSNTEPNEAPLPEGRERLSQCSEHERPTKVHLGGVHRFRARQVGPYYAPAHFPPGAMRGWRLTFVGGEGITKTFEVVSNTDHEFVVKALDVPFDGVAVNDMFLVENIKSAEPIK